MVTGLDDGRERSLVTVAADLVRPDDGRVVVVRFEEVPDQVPLTEAVTAQSSADRSYEARIEALFCSEAVAETLQRCGVLDTTRPSYSCHPQDYLPGHYSGATFDKRLCSGVAYGDLVRVRGPDNEAI